MLRKYDLKGDCGSDFHTACVRQKATYIHSYSFPIQYDMENMCCIIDIMKEFMGELWKEL